MFFFDVEEKFYVKMNRFADYFVICGLDYNSGLEPDRFAGTVFVLLVLIDKLNCQLY